jgi:hypothetical protein
MADGTCIAPAGGSSFRLNPYRLEVAIRGWFDDLFVYLHLDSIAEV